MQTQVYHMTCLREVADLGTFHQPRLVHLDFPTNISLQLSSLFSSSTFLFAYSRLRGRDPLSLVSRHISQNGHHIVSRNQVPRFHPRPSQSSHLPLQTQSHLYSTEDCAFSRPRTPVIHRLVRLPKVASVGPCRSSLQHLRLLHLNTSPPS